MILHLRSALEVGGILAGAACGLASAAISWLCNGADPIVEDTTQGSAP